MISKVLPPVTAAALAALLITGTAFGSSEARPSAAARHERARTLVLDACTACHTLERVTRQHYTAEQWRGVIAGMLSEGVPLTDEETTLVVEYLAAYFGPETQ